MHLRGLLLSGLKIDFTLLRVPKHMDVVLSGFTIARICDLAIARLCDLTIARFCDLTLKNCSKVRVTKEQGGLMFMSVFASSHDLVNAPR